MLPPHKDKRRHTVKLQYSTLLYTTTLAECPRKPQSINYTNYINFKGNPSKAPPLLAIICEHL
jgi:hypothetical protein